MHGTIKTVDGQITTMDRGIELVGTITTRTMEE